MVDRVLFQCDIIVFGYDDSRFYKKNWVPSYKRSFADKRFILNETLQTARLPAFQEH